MDDSVVLKSEMKYSFFILIILICLFFCGISTYFFFFEERESIFLIIFFLLFFLIGSYSVLSYKHVVITNKYFVVYSLLGYVKKKVYFKDVLLYTAIKKQNAKFKHEVEYIEWEELTLYTNETKVKFYSTSYTNYRKLKKKLTKRGVRDLKKESEWQKMNSRLWGIGFVVFGLISLVFLCFVSFKEQTFSSSLLFFILILSYFIYSGTKLYVKNK